MSDDVEVTFVRHGESTHNVSGQWQGQKDVPLSEKGRRQAEALARRLRGERYDLIISSDLIRAHDTASALERRFEDDPSWREIDVGEWEGLSRDDVAERFPEQVEGLLRGGEDVKIGGAESWSDLHLRVDAALERLRARLGSGKRAMVVAHGGVIIGLVSGMVGIRSLRPRPLGRVMNTGMTTLRHEDGAWRLLRFNDGRHLGPVGSWASERLGRGDAVISLIGYDDAVDEPDPGGRQRGGSLLAAERLAGWYRGVDAVYAHASRGTRNFAAVLAGRYEHDGPETLEGSPDTLKGAIRGLAGMYGGRRVALVAPTAAIARYAAALLAPDGEGKARVAAPGHGSVTHIVVTGSHETVAEYNLV